MLTTLISIFASGTLLSNDISTPAPNVMPWNEDITVEVSSIPHKKEENIAPVLTAKSAIVVDLKNGIILYEKNIHETLPIASLTKLMTAILILEQNQLNETAVVSHHSVQTPGSKIWLYEGEQLSVKDLLYASLINSANDAATALAEHNSGNIDSFVEKMNLRAEELGLHTTKFFNPTGLDEYIEEEAIITKGSDGDDDLLNNPNPENTFSNQSSAFDLALLARFAYGKSFIRKAAITKKHIIYAQNLNLEHKLENTNKLLNSYLNVLGLKTGTTDTAGQCLIAIIRNQNNKDILTVVLGSKNRYEDTKLLADWTFRTFTWI